MIKKEIKKVGTPTIPKVVIKNIPGDRIQDSYPKASNVPPPRPKK